MFTGKQSAPSGDYEFFNPGDPAFDHDSDAYNFQRWVETQDPKWLPCKNGVKPWRFKFRRVRGEAKEFLRDKAAMMADDPELAKGNRVSWWFAALALKTVVDPDGTEHPVDRVPYKGFQVAEDAWLEPIAEDRLLLLEIANYVIRKEFSPSPK